MIPYFGSGKRRVELTIRAGWRGTDEKLHRGHFDVRNNTWSRVDASKRCAHDWHQRQAHSETASASFGRGGRAATVDEIAELFVFLASDKSSYTSGTIVTVDGGITSRRSVS
ncbi:MULTISPECIES: SDR family oxidoreductase [Burkholderia]|uniref:SDR family oxidoreductase n=1 Tax=Burkholderia aenigmatica TaxID=2015348 RepID=UPI001581F4C9